MGNSANRAKAKEFYEQMKALVEKPGLMSRNDEQEFYRLEKQIQKLTKDEPGSSYSGVFDLKKLSGYQRDKVEKVTLCEFLRSGSVPDDLMPLIRPTGVRLAQQSTSGSAGGYTIPTGMVNDLEVSLTGSGGMWENARIVKTDKGNSTAWGYTNDTANKAYILSESADGTTDADAVVFGQKEFTGFKYTSGVIQVPNELLQDSELFAEEFTSILSDRFSRGTNEHFTTGDGSGKPTGAAVSATYGVSTTADGDIASADILNLIYSVNSGYRRNGHLMMHSSTLKAIQSKADSTTEEKPFWTPPYKPGDDPAGYIWGFPVIINDNLAEFAGEATSADDNKKIILFGDFKKYIIRQARDFRIVRFSHRYADLDQTAFAVFLRVDGDVLNAGTDPIKYLRVSTT